MDMNWIDEIRDPEPRKRYIYNADDYDPQYGDQYYREHSTRADSLWRLYEESGTSITFDAFADESRQTDYRMETGALRDFFNGSQSVLSSYRNPMGGNPLIAFGSIGRWDGELPIIPWGFHRIRKKMKKKYSGRWRSPIQASTRINR